MGIDPVVAGFISNEVIAGLYALLLVAALTALWGPWHAKTSAIKWFARLLAINAACRCIFFAVPPESWGSTNTPEDVHMYSSAYWKLFGQFIFYLIADFAGEGEYLQILHLWQLAQAILTESPLEGTPARLLRAAYYVMLIWQLCLVGLFLGYPFHVVLATSSAGKLLICVCMVFAFAYYAVTLWNTMKQTTLHATYGRTSCWSTIASVLFPSTQSAGLLNDTSESNVTRARLKLAIISRVCVVYGVASILKVGVVAYQLLVMLPHSSISVSANTWWAFVVCNYFLTEIWPAALMLWILRKPSKRRRQARGYSAVDPSEMESVVSTHHSDIAMAAT